jgi:hypothetical protein
MTNSLNAMFPVLGRILGETPDALRAHQRAFVRAGLLESIPGKGPGSGVRASPETLAEFLIGMLTNASIAANVPVAKAFGNARRLHHGKCPLTDAIKFKDALARLLTSEQLARRVSNVSLVTLPGYAAIYYDEPPGEDGVEGSTAPPRSGHIHIKSSIFFTPGAPSRGGLSFQGLIPRQTLMSLVKAMPT